MTKRIGALWLKKSGEGKNYMSGVLEDLRGPIQIAVFKNDKKEAGSNQPDYNIVLSGDRTKKDESDTVTSDDF